MTEMERKWLWERVVEIIWLHPDIPLEHLQFIRGITLVEPEAWKRCQEWDSIFSFYDPHDQRIKIRQDQAANLNRFEMVFLVALGQSLLGNYALSKRMEDIFRGQDRVGRVYRLQVREKEQLFSCSNQKIWTPTCRFAGCTGSKAGIRSIPGHQSA
jgi:hypothetical protein